MVDLTKSVKKLILNMLSHNYTKFNYILLFLELVLASFNFTLLSAKQLSTDIIQLIR
jgi:hypothetical protein